MDTRQLRAYALYERHFKRLADWLTMISANKNNDEGLRTEAARMLQKIPAHIERMLDMLPGEAEECGRRIRYNMVSEITEMVEQL